MAGSLTYIDRFGETISVNGVTDVDIKDGVLTIAHEEDPAGNQALIIAPGEWHDVVLNKYEI